MKFAGPSWFERSLATPGEPGTVEVQGAAIHYLAWGSVDSPGLVLIHGGGANSHWWSFLAPLFADDYRVVALDLSGNGDSDWREGGYSLQTWTDEVVAVIEDSAMAPRPIVVGHSMGGFVTIATAAFHSDAIGGAIVLDSPVAKPDPEMEQGRRGFDFKNPKVYPSRELATEKWRTVPAQKHYEPFIKRYVAWNSLKEVDDGWTWKFDSRLFLPKRSEPGALLSKITCRVAVFRSEFGLVTDDIGRYMYEQLGRVAPVIEIPQAGHHMMLDQPLLLLTGLRTLLADWEHSLPFTRS
ncbi:MAG: alpha/beta hydrolase [Acidimicrobiales bacterium]